MAGFHQLVTAVENLLTDGVIMFKMKSTIKEKCVFQLLLANLGPDAGTNHCDD